MNRFFILQLILAVLVLYAAGFWTAELLLHPHITVTYVCNSASILA